MSGVRMLLRRATRDTWSRRFRVAAIGLIVASGMAMYAGVYSAIDGLFDTRDRYYQEGNIADLELRFIGEDVINLPDFGDVPDILAVESRLLMPGNIELPDGRRLGATMVALDANDAGGTRGINRLTMLAGAPLDPARPNEVVIERSLAKYHGYGIGDRLRLNVGKDSYDDLTIRGIARSPEYLLASSDPSLFLPSKGSLGVVYVAQPLIEQRLGFRLVNSLLFDLDPRADRSHRVQEIAERADRKLALDEIIPLQQQFGYLFLNVDLNAFAVFVPAIVIIFAVTAVLVTLFLLFQWVSNQRREIGLLMALGYGRPRIVLAYAVPVLGLAAAAVLAGYSLSYVTLDGFGFNYARAMGMPPPRLFLNPELLAAGAGGVVVVLLLASIWPQSRILTLTPQDAVRGERARTRPAMGPFVRRLAGVFGGRLWLRYALRNLVRGKLVSAMTIISVALALGVSISYFIAMTSFDRSLVGKVEHERWDLTVDFQVPLWMDELGRLDTYSQIRAIDPYLRGAIRLVSGDRRKSSLVTGIDPASSLRGIRLKAGRGIAPGDRDVLILEQRVARELGYALGDQVTVESRDKRFQARLIGISTGALPGESVTDIDTARRWLDLEDQITGVAVDVTGPPEALRQQLFGWDRVGRVTVKNELIGQLRQIMDEVLVILYIAEVFSIGVAVLFVFSSMSFLVLERRSEYGLLKILGFRDRVVAGSVVTEVVLIGVLGGLLAVPLGWGIAVYLCERLSEAWFAVAPAMQWRDALIIIVPTLVLLPVAVLPALRRVQAAPLAGILRERMFG